MYNERIIFIDYLRLIACFMVMLVHASENFYGADWTGLAGDVSLLANESNRFWVAFYDGFLSRDCVPLFLIASAFLLVPLKPGVTMAQFYRKRLLRVVPPMAFFMLVYCFLPLAWGGIDWATSKETFSNILWNFPANAGHLWFMYPLIGLYLIMPVVSPWLEKASKRDELIFLALFGISTFMPWIRLWIAPEVWGECFWNEYHALWYCSGFLGYLVLAHFINHHLDWSARRRVAIGAVCALVGGAFTGWSFWLKGVPGEVIDTPLLEWAWRFCSPNLVVMTFGTFLLFSAIPRHKVPALITDISRRSFGMYLVHMFYLSAIASWIVGGNPTEPLLPVAVAIPVIAIASYVCSYITIRLAGFIPGAKWLVG